MSKLAASSRAFAFMLPYSLGRPICRFCSFRSRNSVYSPAPEYSLGQPTGNENARPHRTTFRNCSRIYSLLAGGDLCHFAALRCPAGALRAGCRAFAADRARAGRLLDARRPADDGRRRRGAPGRSLGRRPARRTADAVERGRQLCEHAVADPDFPLSVPDAGDDARRMGRIQSLAGADGLEHRRRVRIIRDQGVAGVSSRRGARGGRGCARPSLQRLHTDRRSVVATPDRGKGLHQMSKANLLERRSVVGRLLAARKDAIVVGGLCATTYDIAAAGDHDRNLYLWGAMGGAVMIGLGIALAQPDVPVVVITGDGEMLMVMGSLATVGLQNPGHPPIFVRKNGVTGEPGGQGSHTAATVDLVGVARACGIKDARAIATMADIEAFALSMQDVSSGPRFGSIKIDSANLERVLSSRDGSFIVTRIRGALGFGPI